MSGATIRSALAAVGAVGKQIRSFDELAVGANDALRQAPPGLTALGAASFLATTAQESAYYRTTREYGSGQWYAPWIGRGFVQCTHKANYQAFGRWCHRKRIISDPDLFIKNRAALEDYRYAWATACWYFDETNLWRYANAGNHLATSQGVNGGVGRIGTRFVPNHWRERNAMFQAFRRAGDALLPPTGGPAPAAVRPTTPPEPRRRRRNEEDLSVFIETPEPPDGTAKIDWPRKRFVYGFDPIGGWGGKCILRVNFGPRGGWLHLARWWIRLPDWSPNNRHRMKFWDHPVGAKGTDFAIAADWETAPPVGASSIELDLSAPDGVHIFMPTEH